MKISNYMDDGANYQAQAVLAFLRGCLFEETDVDVARWENCREQGYVLTKWIKDKGQLCIAFFEHRNSDSICAVKWIQEPTINAPTIDNAKFGDIYKDKYDVSHSVGFGKAEEMSRWIRKEIEAFIGDSTNR